MDESDAICGLIRLLAEDDCGLACIACACPTLPPLTVREPATSELALCREFDMVATPVGHKHTPGVRGSRTIWTVDADATLVLAVWGSTLGSIYR